MELSIWYEGHLRTDPGPYGINHSEELNSQAHLFWTEAALAYTLPKSQQSFYFPADHRYERGFNGKIEQVHVKYLGTPAQLQEEKKETDGDIPDVE